MSKNPINLVIRFLLEISALISMGIWGWQQSDGILRYVFAFGVPLIAAAVWGTFRVPNDPGKASIVIPGLLRLAYEVVFFGFATWALMDANYVELAWVIAVILVIHYIISYDRVIWLIKQ
jgi:hypothetical protein